MALFDALDVYAPTKAHGAAMNMAIDEALLETSAVPSLRFYGWRRPSISFGYFGRFADVEPEQAEHDIVRRWTGGGIVFHGADLTYSLVLPSDIAARFRSSRLIYSAVHGAIREALGANSSAALATAAAPKVSEACFANPVEADILLDGRKIAGAAQRRTRSGLLHQGSIQCDALPPAFRRDFARALCPASQQKQLAPELIMRAEQIARAKYATNEWLRRR
jgi:lipoyl(octanoyl) transferase